MIEQSKLPASPHVSALLVTLVAFSVACTPDGSAQAATVNDLLESNAQQRYEAVKTLKRDWPSQIGRVLKEITGFKDEINAIAQPRNEKRRVYFRAMTDALRAMINEGGRDAITLFRKSDDHDVIVTLVRAARGQDRGIRINATLILANVADNSSVCVAIDELRDPKLDDNGRINLLQVVRTVASYMYKESWQAANKSLRVVESRLDRKSQDYKRSLNLIRDIDARLKRNDRKNQSAPPRHSSCANYIYRQ